VGQSEYELALLSRGRRDALVGGGQPSGSPTRGAGLGSVSALVVQAKFFQSIVSTAEDDTG